MTIEQSVASADQEDHIDQLAQLLWGFRVSQMLRAMAELSIADHLAQFPMSARQISRLENAVEDFVFRLLRAGVAVGLVRVDHAGRFETTPLLDTLRRDSPRSLRGWVLSTTASYHWAPWNQFVESVKTGADPVVTALGSDLFTYLAKHPEHGQEFSGGMSALTAGWAQHVPDILDTRGVECAVDVGGGNGSLLHLLQRANPSLRGLIFDRPNVIDEVADTVQGGPFADRTETMGGDFFTAVPVADLYLLKMILHDWDDERCLKILRRCRASLRPGGRVAIIELIVGSLPDPGLAAALSDLNMMVVCDGGRERTLDEYEGLLVRAGLRLTKATTVRRSQHSVIEAIAA
jgi:hypothetical protein